MLVSKAWIILQQTPSSGTQRPDRDQRRHCPIFHCPKDALFFLNEQLTEESVPLCLWLLEKRNDQNTKHGHKSARRRRGKDLPAHSTIPPSIHDLKSQKHFKKNGRSLHLMHFAQNS